MVVHGRFTHISPIISPHNQELPSGTPSTSRAVRPLASPTDTRDSDDDDVIFEEPDTVQAHERPSGSPSTSRDVRHWSSLPSLVDTSDSDEDDVIFEEAQPGPSGIAPHTSAPSNSAAAIEVFNTIGEPHRRPTATDDTAVSPQDTLDRVSRLYQEARIRLRPVDASTPPQATPTPAELSMPIFITGSRPQQRGSPRLTEADERVLSTHRDRLTANLPTITGPHVREPHRFPVRRPRPPLTDAAAARAHAAPPNRLRTQHSPTLSEDDAVDAAYLALEERARERPSIRYEITSRLQQPYRGASHRRENAQAVVEPPPVVLEGSFRPPRYQRIARAPGDPYGSTFRSRQPGLPQRAALDERISLDETNEDTRDRLAADLEAMFGLSRADVDDLEGTRDFDQLLIEASEGMRLETEDPAKEARIARAQEAHAIDNQAQNLRKKYSRGCGVCLTNPNPRVRVVLGDCGHTMCEPCVDQLEDRIECRMKVRCPFCRKWSGYVRLFETEEDEEAVEEALHTPPQAKESILI